MVPFDLAHHHHHHYHRSNRPHNTVVFLVARKRYIDFITSSLYRQTHYRRATLQIQYTDLLLHVVPGLLIGVRVILHRFLQGILHRHAEIVLEHRRRDADRELDHEDYQQRGRELDHLTD